MNSLPLDDSVRGGPFPGAVLVVAKSPVAGRAKTRLAAGGFTAADAAGLAAAALLDTLEAARAVPAAAHVVAFDGDPAEGRRPEEVAAALAEWTVVPQRGDGFGARLAAAHAAAAGAAGGGAVLQIGMDTPQAGAGLLARCGGLLGAGGRDAVLGAAEDGGWWLLALRDAGLARVLAGVPMSRADTGELTAAALRAVGARVVAAPPLRDVDTPADARAVAAAAPDGRFAAAVRAALGTAGVGAP